MNKLERIAEIIKWCEVECNSIAEDNLHCAIDDINYTQQIAYQKIKKIMEVIDEH